MMKSSLPTAPAAATAADVAAVLIEGLRVVRGDRVVLDGFDLTVRKGSLTGLMGPNGSGKTTLMRAIVGVQKIAAGRVDVLGRPAGSPELRHRIGYVTQAPSVYGDLSGALHIAASGHSSPDAFGM